MIPVKPNRSLPPELDTEAQRIESEGWVQYLLKKFEEAKKQYEKDLALRYKFQESEKRPVHKGAPLHMLGVCTLYQGKMDESIPFFLQAYAEDTLLTDYDEEDEADRSPAATVLREVIAIRMRAFRAIKFVARELKKSKWDQLFDPMEIVKPSLEQLGLELKDAHKLRLSSVQLRLREKTPLGFPQPVDFRVFIGGKYGDSDATIEKVREIVLRMGYTPVVARDVETPPDKTHEFAARLLHTCGYAIFDMSVTGGQYMEIERATDYGVKMLLIHKTGTHVSTMARTAPGVASTEEFEVDEDLEEMVFKFLPPRFMGKE